MAGHALWPRLVLGSQQTIFSMCPLCLVSFACLFFISKQGGCVVSANINSAGTKSVFDADLILADQYVDEDGWKRVEDVGERRRSRAATPRRADSFVEFYTGLSSTEVDKQTLLRNYSQVVDKLRLYRRLELTTDSEPRQDEISVSNRLHSALNFGRLPDSEHVHVGGPDGVESYWTQVRGEITLSGSLLEVGDCVTSFQIAADHPNLTVVALVLTDVNIPFCAENARSGGLENFNLGFVKPAHLEDLVEELYSNPQVMFGNVLLSNLTQLAQGLLPHELEGVLARILSLSPHSFLINSHTGHMTTYFTSQWSSPKALLQSSCQRGGLDCSITSPYLSAIWKNNGTLYTVTVSQGARDLPPTTCHKVTNRPDCVLLYNNDSSAALIQAADGRTFPYPLNYSTITLAVLLRMNPVLETREKLFRQMLMLPLPAEEEQTTHTLVLSGSRLIWLQNTINSVAGGQELGNKGSAISPGSPERGVSKDKAGVQALSIKRYGIQSDDNHNDQWLGKNSRSVDGEVHKAGGMFAEIDDQWDRVDEGKPPAKGGQAGFREEPNVIQRSQEEGEEPGMTKDEQELQQAIGFLHGEKAFKDPIQFVTQSSFKSSASPRTFAPSKTFSKQQTGSIEQKLYVKPKAAMRQTVSPGYKGLNFQIKSRAVQKTVSDTETPPNLVQPPEQHIFVQNLEVNGGKEIPGVPDSASITRHPKPIPRPGWGKRGPQMKGVRRAQNGQRHLLMVNANVAKEYSNSLGDHNALTNSKYAVKQEHLADSALTQTKVSKIKVEDTKNSPYSTLLKSFIDEANSKALHKVRPFHHAFTHRKRDHQSFDHYWRTLRVMFEKETEQADAHFNLLTFGGEGLSLLGMKVASVFPASTVVTIMSPGDQNALASHRQVMKMLTRRNCLLLINDMDADVLSDLQHLPELFRFQVIGVEVFTQLLLLGETFLYYLGQWLMMARTTVLEVPRPETLQLAYSTLYPRGRRAPTPLFKGIVEEAIQLVGGTARNIQILAGASHHGYRPVSQRRLMKVDMDTLQRQVSMDCSRKSGDLQLRPDGVALLSHVTDQDKLSLTPIGRSASGVGLELILKIGPSAAERKSLFLKYLSLPVNADMCPTHLVYFNESLVYHPVDTPSTHLYTNPEAHHSAQTQSLLQLFSSELGPEPFSFMEYNSREGGVITSLTAKYKNSTFVSLQEEITLAKKLYWELREDHLDNIVICVLDINRDFTQKMLKSPDFLRYQFISSGEFLGLMKKSSKGQFDLLLGEILATSVTTFVQVPSATIFSLAMTTFFPEEQYNSVERGPAEKKNMYMRSYHPRPVYRNAELKFLREACMFEVPHAIVSARANLNITISASVLSPYAEAITQPWRVIRVDVRNLSVQVDHHFDYSKDGHSRKYRQHCEAQNKSSYEVYLIREQDGFKIPYGQVHAISLIALLRMGILSEIKTHFYDKFLRLPLYEDMAPWNIVFQAGDLDYIDYDSKDVTFDKMVPAAYQILAMLMNYERTVKDFGNCGEHAKNAYQFKLISNCVGNSGFDGPCSDSRFPVPCGDHTCRSTFIECLQVLNLMEKQKASRKSLGFQHEDQFNTAKSSDTVVDSGLTEHIWTYNHKGAV